MRGIGVEEAAAIGAEHLDGDLRGHRPHRDGLLGAFQRRCIDIGAERLRHALPDQEQRVGHANRDEDIERAAGDIDPETADGAHRMPRETADQRDGEHDAGRCRQEVLVRQAEHLHEIRQRALAAVVLPVGIGDEADRRVERQILGDRRLLGGIERQERLQAHQCVNDEQAAEMKQQHADRVGHGVLLLPLVDAGDLVDHELDRPQDRRQECALAVEHARHIGAEHRRERDDDGAIEQNLDPADDGHGRYSFRTVRA